MSPTTTASRRCRSRPARRRGGKQVNSMVAGINMAVFKNTKNRDAALKFVKFMTSDEEQKILNKTYGSLPPVKAAQADPAFQRREQKVLQRDARHDRRAAAAGARGGQFETLVGTAMKELFADAASGEPVTEESRARQARPTPSSRCAELSRVTGDRAGASPRRGRRRRGTDGTRHRAGAARSPGTAPAQAARRGRDGPAAGCLPYLLLAPGRRARTARPRGPDGRRRLDELPGAHPVLHPQLVRGARSPASTTTGSPSTSTRRSARRCCTPSSSPRLHRARRSGCPGCSASPRRSLLQRPFRGRGLLRTLFLIPYALPVYAGRHHLELHAPARHRPGQPRPASTSSAWPTSRPFWLIGDNSFWRWSWWRSGGPGRSRSSCLMAGLQNIPRELYEAAAGRRRRALAAAPPHHAAVAAAGQPGARAGAVPVDVQRLQHAVRAVRQVGAAEAADLISIHIYQARSSPGTSASARRCPCCCCCSCCVVTAAYLLRHHRGGGPPMRETAAGRRSPGGVVLGRCSALFTAASRST